MSYDRMTSDDPTIRREPIYRDADSGTRTVVYIVAALVVLGLVYLAASMFWGAPTSSTLPSTTTTIETLPPAAPPATMTPAPEVIAPAPDATLAPEPSPAAPPATAPVP